MDPGPLLQTPRTQDPSPGPQEPSPRPSGPLLKDLDPSSETPGPLPGEPRAPPQKPPGTLPASPWIPSPQSPDPSPRAPRTLPETPGPLPRTPGTLPRRPRDPSPETPGPLLRPRDPSPETPGPFLRPQDPSLDPPRMPSSGSTVNTEGRVPDLLLPSQPFPSSCVRGESPQPAQACSCGVRTCSARTAESSKPPTVQGAGPPLGPPPHPGTSANPSAPTFRESWCRPHRLLTGLSLAPNEPDMLTNLPAGTLARSSLATSETS